MRVAVLVRLVAEAAQEARLPWVGDVEADEARVPVGDKQRPAILGRVHPVAERGRGAALPQRRVQPEILMDAEAGDKRRICRIGHVDDPRVASVRAAGRVTSHRPSPRLPAAAGSVRNTSQTCSPTAAMSWPASGPYLAV